MFDVAVNEFGPGDELPKGELRLVDTRQIVDLRHASISFDAYWGLIPYCSVTLPS